MTKQTEWIRVSEYARREKISVVAAHKRIKTNKVQSKKGHNLILVKP